MLIRLWRDIYSAAAKRLEAIADENEAGMNQMLETEPYMKSSFSFQWSMFGVAWMRLLSEICYALAGGRETKE